MTPGVGTGSGIVANHIKMALFDVDGVLTDGTLYMGEAGETVKPFHVRDGLAVALLHAHGIRCGVISGRSSAALDYRVRQLGMDVALTGTLEKRTALETVLHKHSLSPHDVAYVGDDVVDLPLAGYVGRFYAPADAHPLVLAVADFVLDSRGGRGAMRETAEHILSLSGMNLEEMYSPFLDGWEPYAAVQ